MLHPKYPNLELLEYKVKQLLSTDDKVKKKIEDIRKTNGYAFVEIEVDVFPQMWGSTCTGFDEAEDGSPAIGGCAMTKAYTCVFHELLTDTYVVCIDDRPCYMVQDANSEFLEDLKNRIVCGLHDAKRKY